MSGSTEAGTGQREEYNACWHFDERMKTNGCSLVNASTIGFSRGSADRARLQGESLRAHTSLPASNAHGRPMLATILLLLVIGLIPCTVIVAVYERAAQRALRQRSR
jgi:hypothetical protein